MEKGQRVGMIKFGSRTDIILPAEAEIRVKPGQRVKGGSSIVAEMPASELAAGVSSSKKVMRASAIPDEELGESA